MRAFRDAAVLCVLVCRRTALSVVRSKSLIYQPGLGGQAPAAAAVGQLIVDRKNGPSCADDEQTRQQLMERNGNQDAGDSTPVAFADSQ